MEVLGKCILRVGKLNRTTYPVEFFVVDKVYLVNDVDPDVLD